MHWLTVLWSMIASACLTLTLVHLTIWFQDRSNRAHLLFSLTAAAVAGVAAGEFLMFRAQTPEQFGLYMRWVHVPLLVTIVSIVAFVRVYFRAGRLWLAWTVCVIRLLVVLINFSVLPNVNYTKIVSVEQHSLPGGESMAIASGDISPWTRLAQLGSILFLVYVIDATITVRRRGTPVERRRALWVGGSLAFFVLVAAFHTTLVQQQIVRTPYLISLSFIAPLAVMAYQLGSDVVRLSQLAQQLAESQSRLHDAGERIELAGAAAELGFWEWDVGKDSVWATDQCRRMFGFASAEKIDMCRLLDRVHPDDRTEVGKAIEHALTNSGEYQGEYRVVLPTGQTHWLAARGRVEAKGKEKSKRMRGVVLDFTRRKEAEEQFRLAVEASPNGMVIADGQGVVRFANGQAETIFGYRGKELLGEPFEMLIPGCLHDSRAAE